MARGTLIIENVNFDMLEEQRQSLIRVLFSTDINQLKYETENLEGLLAMLDNWADERDGYE